MTDALESAIAEAFSEDGDSGDQQTQSNVTRETAPTGSSKPGRGKKNAGNRRMRSTERKKQPETTTPARKRRRDADPDKTTKKKKKKLNKVQDDDDDEQPQATSTSTTRLRRKAAEDGAKRMQSVCYNNDDDGDDDDKDDDDYKPEDDDDAPAAAPAPTAVAAVAPKPASLIDLTDDDKTQARPSPAVAAGVSAAARVMLTQDEKAKMAAALRHRLINSQANRTVDRFVAQKEPAPKPQPPVQAPATDPSIVFHRPEKNKVPYVTVAGPGKDDPVLSYSSLSAWIAGVSNVNAFIAQAIDYGASRVMMRRAFNPLIRSEQIDFDGSEPRSDWARLSALIASDGRGMDDEPVATLGLSVDHDIVTWIKELEKTEEDLKRDMTQPKFNLTLKHIADHLRALGTRPVARTNFGLVDQDISMSLYQPTLGSGWMMSYIDKDSKKRCEHSVTPVLYDVIYCLRHFKNVEEIDVCVHGTDIDVPTLCMRHARAEVVTPWPSPMSEILSMMKIRGVQQEDRKRVYDALCERGLITSENERMTINTTMEINLNKGPNAPIGYTFVLSTDMQNPRAFLVDCVMEPRMRMEISASQDPNHGQSQEELHNELFVDPHVAPETTATTTTTTTSSSSTAATTVVATEPDKPAESLVVTVVDEFD